LSTTSLVNHCGISYYLKATGMDYGLESSSYFVG
jgi:hypothetical protein